MSRLFNPFSIWKQVPLTSRTVGEVTGNVTGNVAGSVAGSVNSVTNSVTVSSGTVTTVSGNVNGSVGSVTGAVGSVTGSIGGNLNGSVLGNVNGSVGSVTTVSDKTGYSLTAGSYSVIRSIQEIAVAIGTTVGTYHSAISAVTLAKSILVPGSFFAGITSAQSLGISNWRFTSVTRVQVDLIQTTTTTTPANAYVYVVEFY